ncbi:MFS transporter [Hyphomicrobiales bacterium]|nr:MFS transporter [Hyphomicrobiales bacterium]CAH1691378.1 MFS transporter [Hyphomicrobiales bacterium]
MTEEASAARRPWQIVSALGIQQIICWGSTYYLIAVLAPAIMAEMGWPLPWVVGALSAALIADGLVAPFVGKAIGYFGGRIVLAFGAAIVACGLALIAMSQSIWFYLFAWSIVGVGMAASLYDPAFSLLSQLYGAQARRPITALTLWGGFSITISWPCSALLLDAFGWRGVALSYAAANILLCVPLIMGVIPRLPPRERPSRPEGKTALRLVGRERGSFLVLATVQTITGFTITIVSVHLLTMLQSRGLSQAEAVALGALIGPAQFLSRLLEMTWGGRQHPIWNLIAAIALNTVGIILLAIAAAPAALALILFAAGTGILSIVRGALPLALFGAARYPVLLGRLSLPSLIAQAMAPLAGGVLISGLGVQSAVAAIAALLTGALVLAIMLERIRPR